MPWNTKGITLDSDLCLKFSKLAAATSTRGNSGGKYTYRNPLKHRQGLNQGCTKEAADKLFPESTCWTLNPVMLIFQVLGIFWVIPLRILRHILDRNHFSDSSKCAWAGSTMRRQKWAWSKGLINLLEFLSWTIGLNSSSKVHYIILFLCMFKNFQRLKKFSPNNRVPFLLKSSPSACDFLPQYTPTSYPGFLMQKLQMGWLITLHISTGQLFMF